MTEEQVANQRERAKKIGNADGTNFDEGDLVLTVTYRDADLPDSAGIRAPRQSACADAAYRKARGLLI
ncbi:MAG: hypothetical protein ACLUDF_09245 [Butyricicoccus sp.]